MNVSQGTASNESTSTHSRAAQPPERPLTQVTHDLRNALTGLIGNISLLRDHPNLPAEVSQGLVAIEKAALQARTLSLELNVRSPENGSEKQPAKARIEVTVKAAAPPAAPPRPAAVTRILAMDDEPGIRALLAAALSHFGYEATTVSDGAEAIREYREALGSPQPFSAVIMDLTVPGGMGGKEALKALKSIDPKVKAIVSSGLSADPAIADFKTFGFVARVDKPYRIQELGNILRAALQS